MKKFIKKSLLFIIPIIIFCLTGVLLPTTPNAKTSLLMGSIKKDSLLKNTISPRLILIGGSNVSFGINSSLIKQELNINPINTAIQGKIGLKFMMDNTLEYIKNGDIILLIPEYKLFYQEVNNVSEVLTHYIFDCNKKKLKHLNIYQLINLIPHIPKYSFSKFLISSYTSYLIDDSYLIYSSKSFNKFGDTYVHWSMSDRTYDILDEINGDFQENLLKEIVLFNEKIQERKAKLYVSFACYEERSFKNSKNKINYINTNLKKTNLSILGEPEDFMFNDSLIFNYPYHLNKKGVDHRTKLIIKQLKKISQ